MKSDYKEKKTLITVCSACKRACCWQGEFMCDDSREASTVEKTIAQLEKLDLENPEWWLNDYEDRI